MSTRRGSVYVFVLGMSVLIMATAVAAAMTARAELERVGSGDRVMRASFAARSGMDIELALLESGALGSWRSSVDSSRWYSLCTIDGFQLESNVKDPDDNELDDSTFDRLKLTVRATSVDGEVVQYRSVMLRPTIRAAAAGRAYRVVPGTYAIEMAP